MPKTLKDITKLSNRALRKEAIVWIKEHQTGKSRVLPETQKFAVIRWIKYFFGITEDDLK